MKQTFETEDFREALERSLGFALRSLERLDGASSVNFKAVRESDGMVFAVKCSPPERQELFDHLVRHLADLRETKAAKRLFERECPPTYGGYNVICLSWCPGVRMFPDRLTDAEFIAFLDDYLEFSAALQKTALIAEADPIRRWRDEALAKCSGLAGWILRRILRELPDDELVYRTENRKVVHADFHHGNFLFVGGRVSGYFDLEEFSWGYPADDLLRYLCCAAEHLRWYAQWRKRRILYLFAMAVRHMPYPAHEWRVAINARFMNRVFMTTHDDSRIRLRSALNLAFRAMFYGRLRGIVASWMRSDMV